MTQDDREKTRSDEKTFVSVEQVNSHFFPKPSHEKPTTDGGKRGQETADRILEDISKDFR